MAPDKSSTKLPQFWPTNPRAWFIQAEAQFAIREINADDIKYWHVVAALDRDIAASCTPILEGAPSKHKYPYLKRKLMERFELSDAERADKLLDIRDLGDRRPSELADLILQLNGSNDEHFILRRIFMRALPVTLRNALSTSTASDLRGLAREADRALSTTGHREPAVNSLQPDSESLDLDAVTRRRTRTLCFYHRKWGVRAKRCEQPCEWVSSPATSSKQGNAAGGAP